MDPIQKKTNKMFGIVKKAQEGVKGSELNADEYSVSDEILKLNEQGWTIEQSIEILKLIHHCK